MEREEHETSVTPDEWETPCPGRADQLHCVHWYDGGACCGCGDAALDDEDLDDKSSTS